MNTIKAKHQTSMRTTLFAVALAILCQGCPGTAHHSAYRPVHDYAKAGDVVHEAEELSKHPDELNLPDDAGLTPLHLAAARCRTNIVALLLDKGADVDREARDRATPLHLAAQEGCTNVVNMLLLKKAKVNARDDKGRTPLKRAEEWNQPTAVQILRQHGGSE